MKERIVSYLKQTSLVRRLNRLSKLKQEHARVQMMKRMLPVNCGQLVKDQYDLTMLVIALEFEKQRYWWIRPLRRK